MPASTPIPLIFLERMKRFLGEEFPAFETALSAQATSALRVNTLKLAPEAFQERSPLPLNGQVPWASSAFLLPIEAVSPGLHPYHQAGLYYLQDPSAMAPATLLDPQPGERVLDLAAAPGGKTTALAARMQGKGLLVANEIKDKRIGHLAMNMERWGADNIIITNETPERLADELGPFFDKVLVDAPCSGEGMFRKDMGARADWSLEMIQGCAQRQKNILRVAARMVRPGGSLLYSTCTFAPEENEEVILNLVEEFPEYEVNPLPEFPGFMRGQPDWMSQKAVDLQTAESLKGAVRLFPHRVIGEGHFICSLHRREEASIRSVWTHRGQGRAAGLVDMNQEQQVLWRDFKEAILHLDMAEDRFMVRGERLYLTPEEIPDLGSLRVVHPGIWLGTFKKNRFEPAHPLALFLDASRVKNRIDLAPNNPQLTSYLKGETFPNSDTTGWVLICVDGFGLGWGKCVQGVVKNHYPHGWIQP